jgi:hypothetical protein
MKLNFVHQQTVKNTILKKTFKGLFIELLRLLG